MGSEDIRDANHMFVTLNKKLSSLNYDASRVLNTFSENLECQILSKWIKTERTYHTYNFLQILIHIELISFKTHKNTAISINILKAYFQ